MERNKATHIPAEYEGLYYLGDMDLMPKRLRDYPSCLGIERCQMLYEQGWLFHTREDALRVRETMRRAYINDVMAIKGSDNILFNRPLQP